VKIALKLEHLILNLVTKKNCWS